MKLISTVIPLVALFSVASAVNVRYDSRYDDTNGVPTSVPCFDGPGPLIAFNNFGAVKSFPNIAGADTVLANSSGCGSCWKITQGVNSVIVTVVDHSSDGFSLSRKAMDELTNGSGPIEASATQLDESSCGL